MFLFILLIIFLIFGLWCCLNVASKAEEHDKRNK